MSVPATKRRWFWRVGIIGMAGMVLAAVLIASQPRDYPTTPVTHNGEKWRIGYYEGGSFYDYTKHLRVVIHGLAGLGWIEPITIPEFTPNGDARLIWEYLVNHVDSAYLEFVPDAFWSADWNDNTRVRNREDAIQRLADDHDIDLMIAMGTWAGQDLANDRHTVPTVVVSSTNALHSGIIHSLDDSGYNHVQAWIDPTLYLRQAQLFHTIIDFDTLGVIYEATPDGRIYANLDALEIAAEEADFDIVTCVAPDIGTTEEQAVAGVQACFEQLASQVDAVWLNDGHRGLNPVYMPGVLQPLIDHKIATWAVIGSEAVRRGALLSIARDNLEPLGDWTAQVIGRILNGASPRSLGQVYELPFRIVINMETARQIGFEPPASILSIADEVYEQIDTD